MAKVLKTPEESIKDWKIEVTCTNTFESLNPCYHLIEVEASDIYFKIHVTCAVTYYYGFICSNCGCFSRIDDKYIPDYIKTNAKNYDKVVKTIFN